MRRLICLFLFCCWSQFASAQCNPFIYPVSNTTICQNTYLYLSCSLGDTYQWLLNGSPISGATNNSLTVTQAGSYTVEIDSAGCIATSAPVVITVTPVPPQPGPITGSDSVCNGSINAFSIAPVPGATHYRWSSNGLTTWEDFNGDSTVLPIRTGYVGTSASFSSPDATLTVVAYNGTCGPSLPSSKIVKAFGQAVPYGHDPTLDISNLGRPFCPGGSTTLTPFPHGPHGYISPTTYQWYLDGSAIPGATNLDLVIYRGGQYDLEISTNDVCPPVMYPKPVHQDVPNSVTVSPPGPLAMCQSNPQPMHVFFDMAGVDGSYSWTWTIGFWRLNNTLNDVSILPDTSGAYIVVASSTNPDYGTACSVTSNWVQVQMLNCKIVQNGNNLSATPGFDGYQWYQDGVAVTGATADTLTITEDGDYYVIAEDAGNCFDQSATIHAIYEEVEAPGEEPPTSTAKTVGTYPNPNNGSFTLVVHLPLEDKNAVVTITDATGNILYSVEAQVKDGVLEEKIELGHCEASLFLVKVKSQGYSKTTKVLKQ